MRNLKIYYISESYINYLRQFDKNVAYNKNTTRPYIGIVYTYNNYNYFAPLASPKPKHININPKAIEELTEVLPTITDKKYKKMLEEQLTFLNNHKADLFKKINLFQNMYRKGHLSDNIKSRCCEFTLLEEKCKKYNIQ